MEVFNPIFSTQETIEAGYFTSKIFPEVEVLIDEDPFLEVEPENTFMVSNLANLVVKMKEDLISQKDDENQSEQDLEEEEEEEENIEEENDVSIQLEERDGTNNVEDSLLENERIENN